MPQPPTRIGSSRRAPGMTPQERRAMIVAAALPLVAEYGAAVTTSQIARAAGIGEATIFRVFADKDEVLDACIAEATRSDHVIRELASISLDQPLAARLTDAVDALHGHLNRMGAVAGALYTSGHRRRPDQPRPRPTDRDASITATRDAVAELIEPDRDTLRFPPHQVASAFLGLLFTQARQPIDPASTLTAGDLVDIVLFGTTRPDVSKEDQSNLPKGGHG